MSNYPGFIKQDTYYPTIQSSPYESTTVLLNLVKQIVGSDVRSGAKTENFDALKRSGQILPVNAYTRTVLKDEYVARIVGRGVARKDSWLASRIEALGEKYIAATPLYTSGAAFKAAHNNGIFTAQQEAKARLNNHITNMVVDLFENLGESRESSRMILNRVKQLVKYTTNFKRMNQKLLRNAKKLGKGIKDGTRSFQKSDAKRILSELNDMYLEYTFGWNLMYRSVLSAMDVYDKQVHGEPVRKKMSGKGVYETLIYGDWISDNFNSNSTLPTFTWRLKHAIKYECWYGGLLKDEFVHPRTDVGRELGFLDENVIPAFWELTNFSFILDYVINIEEVIGNLRRAPQKLQSESIYFAEKCSVDTTIEVAPIISRPSDGTWTRTGSGWNTNSRLPTSLMYFHREPSTTNGLIVYPTLLLPSWKQAVNTLSVAANVLKVLH